MSLPFKRRSVLWTFIAVIVMLHVWMLVLLAEPWLASHKDGQGRTQREAGIVVLQDRRTLPAVELAGTDDSNWNMATLGDNWYLVFFGYTYCPDICPTTLAEIRRLYRQLPDELRDRLQVLMVSVDPARDTTSQLRAYLDFFDPDFQGLTGELADIQALSQALGIPFIPGDTSKPGYTVDHGGNLAIISPDGRQAGFIRAPLQVDALIGQLPLLMLE